MFADKLIKNLASKNSPLKNISARYGSYTPVQQGVAVEKEERTLLEVLTKPLHGHRCQFFDFGHIPYSCVGDEYTAAYPAWCEGFLKLPSPLCFFEFSSSFSPQELDSLFSSKREEYTPGTVTVGLLLTETYYTDHEEFGVNIQSFMTGPSTDEITETGAAELLYGDDSPGILVPVTKMSNRLMSRPKEGKDAVMQKATPMFIMLGRLNAEGIEKSVVLVRV